jgi:D-tyrosyl-tRNA(Tyr) deacylase
LRDRPNRSLSRVFAVVHGRLGRRPSFTDAAPPVLAEQLYEAFVARVQTLGVEAATGVFRAHMEVSLVNDGPVTLWIDTAERSDD